AGGQQQRVAIARALAQEATVVLADEPVASLDPESAAGVLDTLRSVAAQGVAVIASLHQVGLARDYADRIIALRDGRILDDAPTRSFDARALEQIYDRSVATAGGRAGGWRARPVGRRRARLRRARARATLPPLAPASGRALPARRPRPRRPRRHSRVVPHDRTHARGHRASRVPHPAQGGLIMANKFCVSITHAKDNTDKATVGFVVANAAGGSGKESLVFLSVEGV